MPKAPKGGGAAKPTNKTNKIIDNKRRFSNASKPEYMDLLFESFKENMEKKDAKKIPLSAMDLKEHPELHGSPFW